MKLRVNDTQLVRAQNKVKELELQIEEWRKAGVLPDSSAPIVPVPVPSASAASPTTTAPSSVPSPTTTAPPARGGAPAPPTRKPSVPGAPANQQPRGRRRGAVRGRGGIDIRGAAAPSAGRGAGSAAAANAAPGGVAIMCAAVKRTREEGEVATEDSSLAKRLKPAVAAAAAEGSASSTGRKPITLQRNAIVIDIILLVIFSAFVTYGLLRTYRSCIKNLVLLSMPEVSERLHELFGWQSRE